MFNRQPVHGIHDTPAGERAGALVMLITATHSQAVETQHPAIRDYNELTLESGDSGELLIRPARVDVSYKLRG